jgi:hypothetical protein
VQARTSSGGLSRTAVAQIGPDVLPLYLARAASDGRPAPAADPPSDVEAALVVGAFVVSAFWKGFADTARGTLERRDERLGLRLLDAVHERLERLLRPGADVPERELPTEAARALTELDRAVAHIGAELSDEAFTALLTAARAQQARAVSLCLTRLGFTDLDAPPLAERLVE